MNTVEIVNEFMLALQIAEYDKAASLLADDFLFSGWTPQPLNASQMMDVMGGLKEGFPDLAFHFEGAHSTEQQIPGTVEGTVQVTGSQSQ